MLRKETIAAETRCSVFRSGCQLGRPSGRPAQLNQARVPPIHEPRCRVRRAASESSMSGQPGTVVREVLNSKERSKLLTDSDNLFYSQPRFVTHVDGNFLAQLTELYRCASAVQTWCRFLHMYVLSGARHKSLRAPAHVYTTVTTVLQSFGSILQHECTVLSWQYSCSGNRCTMLVQEEDSRRCCNNGFDEQLGVAPAT